MLGVSQTNALIHRDYSIAGGAISLAVFDDRVEVWSAGKYPKGITPDMLSRRHPSVQRNPIIADVFYRAGLIEKWGRGTNRVAEMCRAAGIAAPMYEEIGGSVLVTFRVRVGATVRIEVPTGASRRPESSPGRSPEAIVSDARVSLEWRILAALIPGPLGRKGVTLKPGHTSVSGAVKKAISGLLRNERIEYTIPDKPNSRLQEYRLTMTGERALNERFGAGGKGS